MRISAHVHVRVCALMPACSCACAPAWVCACVYMCVRVCTHVRAQKRARGCAQRASVRTHAHAHRHSRVCVHALTPARPCIRARERAHVHVHTARARARAHAPYMVCGMDIGNAGAISHGMQKRVHPKMHACLAPVSPSRLPPAEASLGTETSLASAPHVRARHGMLHEHRS
jgi:hypothetical protein